MAGADPTPKSDFKPAEADCWTVGGGTGAGAVPTPKIDFRPAAAAAPVDWTVPLTGGAVGCGGGGTAAAAETPSIALSSAALLRCGVGFRAVLPDVTKPFHRLKPLLPDFRLPLNPIPFSGGPTASFHPACLPRPADAARFARRPAEPERPWDAALEYDCGALGCDMTGGGGADGVLPVVALATGALHYALYRKLKPWDHAAGNLLHREAGGFSAHLDGSSYAVTGPDVSHGFLYAPDEESWAALTETLTA